MILIKMKLRPTFLKSSLTTNLTKSLKYLLLGSTLFGLSTFSRPAKAEAPPKCTAAIGAKVDGKYTKTAAQIGNSMDYCTETPERFEITIYELGLCTAQPIQTGSPRTFSRNDCVVTMTSSGSTAAMIPAWISSTFRSASTTWRKSSSME